MNIQLHRFNKANVLTTFAVVGALSIITLAVIFGAGSKASAQSTGYIRVLNNCPTSVVYSLYNQSTGKLVVQKIIYAKQSITQGFPAPSQYRFVTSQVSKILSLNAPVSGKAHVVTTYTC